MKSWQRK